MGVEVNGHAQCLFQLRHQRIDAGRIYQACHVFERNHLGADGLHLFRFVYEIFVGEDLLFSTLRVNGVANSCVGYAAEFVDEAD